MRALEITIAMILILTAPQLLSAMGVLPATQETCDITVCQAQNTIYRMANSFQLKAVDLESSPGQIAWDIATLTISFPIYAFFWMLYFLSVVVFIGPALHVMFHIPEALTNFLNIGVWILWLLAYVQWKRGGIGIDGYR